MSASNGKLRPIGEHPEFAEAVELLGTLTAEQAALRQRISTIRDAAYLHAQAETGLSGPEALDQARRLLAGENLDFRDGPAQIRWAEQRLAIISPAMVEQRQRVERIRGELSAAAATSVREQHRKALLGLFSAARALSAAGQAELRVRGELLDKGYSWAEGILPAPRFSQHLTMGSEDWVDSAISFYKRQLEELKII